MPISSPTASSAAPWTPFGGSSSTTFSLPLSTVYESDELMDEQVQQDYIAPTSSPQHFTFLPFEDSPPPTPSPAHDAPRRLPQPVWTHERPLSPPTDHPISLGASHTLFHSFHRAVGQPDRTATASSAAQTSRVDGSAQSTSASASQAERFISVSAPSHSQTSYQPRHDQASVPGCAEYAPRLSTQHPSDVGPRTAGLPPPVASVTPILTHYVIVEGLQNVHTNADWLLRLPGLSGCSALLLSYGCLLLRFNDVREAQASLVAIRFAGIPVLSARCITRHDVEQLHGSFAPDDFLSPSEGTIAITLLNSSQSDASLQDVLPLLPTFGPVRQLTPWEDRLFLVTFYAEASAEMAIEVLNGKEIGGARLACSFESSVYSTQPIFEPVRRASPPASVSHESSRHNTASPRTHQARGMLPPASAARIERWAQTVNSPVQDSIAQPPSLVTPTSVIHQTPSSNPEFGIYRGDDKIPVKNVINLRRIEEGQDVRLTLMLKNIPNKATDKEVMRFIEEVAGRCFDVIYVRQDWRTNLNVGYGFVNFVSTQALLTFARARIGTRWNLCGSDKLCVASYANIQGKSNLIAHFRNSSVLDQEESRRPKLFYTDGPFAGQPEPFPACDDPIRKARSVANAEHYGLFPASKPVFRIAQALTSLNI